MGRFLEEEKKRQRQFKDSPYFSRGAAADGIYRKRPREFCLPLELAAENLFEGIREDALAYFEEKAIKWQDGEGRNPSNHMCDSQVCCVNFLFPFMFMPQALAWLLEPVFPDLKSMLPVEDERYVAFEWIGWKNYLGEKVPQHGRRTRGAHFTGADALVMYEANDGFRQVVLIEWKYTESYGGNSLFGSARTAERTRIYQRLFEAEDCPLDRALLLGFSDLYYEPFYQLMRQQFLANKMERAGELTADIVSLLHVAPAANREYRRITSPNLRPLGPNPAKVWEALVRNKDRFACVDTEKLFGEFDVGPFPELYDWWQYINARYPWAVPAPVPAP